MPTAVPAATGRTELPLIECCSPVVREVLEPADADLLAGRFKALADPTRLRLISLIAHAAERDPADLQTGAAQTGVVNES